MRMSHRRIKIPMTIGVFLLTVSNAAAEMTVEVIGHTENSYTLMLTHDSILGAGQAQQALLPAAQQLCGENSPKFGKYDFSGREMLDPGDSSKDGGESFVFVQEVICGARHEAVRPEVSLSESERREATESVLELSRFYLDSLEKGDYRVAYSMLSEYLQDANPFDVWRDEKQAFQIAAGGLLERDVWNITVYDNPPTAPSPGIYVAADYETVHEEVPFQCGALVWLRQPDGLYRIVSIEEGHLDKSVADRLTQAQIQEVRKKMLRCRPPSAAH